MKLRRVLMTMAAAGAGTLMAGALIASPASAAIHPSDLIVPLVTLTGLNPSAVGFDQQGSVTFNFTVEGDGGDQGTIPGAAPVDVWLNDPNNPGNGLSILCTDPELSFFGEGSCTLPAGTLPVGDYDVFANFRGDDRLAQNSSNFIPLTITKAPTTMTMTQSSPTATVTFGKEGADTFTFTANPRTAGSGPPTGTAGMELVGFAIPVCSGTLVNGSLSCKPGAFQILPGTYTVRSFYQGDGIFTGSTSDGQPLTVLPGATTTTLKVTPSGITTRDPAMLTANVAAVGDARPTGDEIPDGQVDFTADGQPLCSAPLLENGDAVCSPGTLGAGVHQITATYSGDDNYAGSGVTKSITVGKPSSVTSLTLSQGSVTFGQEQAEKLTVTVAGSGGTPAGMVMIKADSNPTPIATISLSGGVAGPVNLTATQFRPGGHTFTAVYAGDGTFAGSTSAPQALTITKASPSTTLVLPTGKLTFGREQAEKLTVKVTGSGGIPTGTVTIKAGTTTVATVPLVNGTATKIFTSTQLKPGGYHLTASYSGDATFAAGSPSGSRTLTVVAEPTIATLALSAAKVKAGHEQAEHLTVTVKPAFTGPAPAGKATIKAGSVTICLATLVNGKGSCTLAASKLRPGSYTVIASYAGVSPYLSSTAPKRTLTVTR